ncbi:hypothetical protein BGX31_007663, partial [Mortierella sp. GBA43]
KNYSLPDTTTLYRFPINSTHPTSPPSQPTTLNFNATQTQCGRLGENFFLLNFRENPLLVCEYIPPTTVSLINGTELTMLPTIVGGIDIYGISVFEIVDFPPAVPYLIYQDMKRTFFSVPLSGQSAGAKIYTRKNMTVAEDYGDNPPRPNINGPDGPLTGWGSGLGKSGSKASTGAIVGGVCAVVVVIIAALGFLFYRRRHQLNNNHQDIDKAKDKANSPLASSSPTTASAAPIVAEPLHSTQPWNHGPIQQQHVQPTPPLQYLQVYDQRPTQQQHNYGHSNSGFVTQPPITSSGPLHGYSSHSPAPATAPAIPVHTRPITTQHGFP